LGTEDRNYEEDVLWEDIQIGDTIYLEKGDTVPADMVVLDTLDIQMHEAICYIDTYLVDGKGEL
jgi:magnesium-transporting ATPase (P-type)